MPLCRYVLRMNLTLQIRRSDSEKRRVYGWAYISRYADGTRVVDLWNAHIPPTVLEEAAARFIASGKAVSSEVHQRDDKNRVVVIGRIIEGIYWDAGKASAFGFEGEVGQFAGFWVGIQIESDEVWEKIKAGEYRDLSIGGSAKMEEVEGMENLEEACKKVEK